MAKKKETVTCPCGETEVTEAVCPACGEQMKAYEAN